MPVQYDTTQEYTYVLKPFTPECEEAGFKFVVKRTDSKGVETLFYTDDLYDVESGKTVDNV